MYTKEELVKKLKKFLRTEMEAVMFYADNLDMCNYERNKAVIDRLILESIDHQKLLVSGLLKLNEGDSKILSSDVKFCALQEETGMKDIYQYTLNHIEDGEIRRILERLVEWEGQHEALAKGLE